jgi:hypothetical protein
MVGIEEIEGFVKEAVAGEGLDHSSVSEFGEMCLDDASLTLREPRRSRIAVAFWGTVASNTARIASSETGEGKTRLRLGAGL